MITVDPTDIAVIGLACRFPGANSPEAFWENILQGRESVTFFSDEELLSRQVDEEILKNPNYVKASPCIDEVDAFDADFFSYSSKEAINLDPQSRVFLQCAWEAMESAGYTGEAQSGKVGVFASQSLNTYLLKNLYPDLDHSNFILSTENIQKVLTNGNDFLASRVSYKLNLTGPSLNLQSACSSSLAAVHLACQNILIGQCDMALAGGVSIYLPQDCGYLYEEEMILSPDGHCRPFDARGSGTIFGRGAGIVVLKSLEEAIADGDNVWAVIKGSAINNDGANKVGFTAPSVEGQAAVIAEALASADIAGSSISYIEAHGTGTRQGDPVEIAGLLKAFACAPTEKGFCAVGSVKSNFGHLDAAAGVAGLIKTVLMLRYKQLVPLLNFDAPNEEIDFSGSPFYINTEARPWTTPLLPRRAGVSAFGMGGTNAHVVLQEAPEPYLNAEAETRANQSCIFTLSAKSGGALTRYVDVYIDFFNKNPTINLADMCFTSNCGRQHFSFRLAFVARSLEELGQQLERWREKQCTEKVMPAESGITQTQPVFIFTGSKADYHQGLVTLCETYPVFRAYFDKCCQAAGKLGEHCLSYVFNSPDLPSNKQGAFNSLTEFAYNYALANTLSDFGVPPKVLWAFSVSARISAACVAGVINLSDGVNTLLALAQAMSQSDPALHAVRTALKHSKINNATMALYGLTEDVQCAVGIENILHWLIASTVSIDDMAAEFSSSFPGAAHIGIALMPGMPAYGAKIDSMEEDSGEHVDSCFALQLVLAQFYQAGQGLVWEEFHRNRPRRRMHLPTYPFEKTRFWAKPEQAIQFSTPEHSLLDYQLFLSNPTFITNLDGNSLGWLKDHEVYGERVFPATAFLEMALAGLMALAGGKSYSLQNIIFKEALIFRDERSSQLQLAFKQVSGELQAFDISSRALSGSLTEDERWHLHVSGELCGGALEDRTTRHPEEYYEEARKKAFADSNVINTVSPAEFYRDFQQRGLFYGPSFRALETLSYSGDSAWGRLRKVAVANVSEEKYYFHPGILDACLQVAMVVVKASGGSEQYTYIPVELRSAHFYHYSHAPSVCHAQLLENHIQSSGFVRADFLIFGSDGALLAEISGLKLQAVPQTELLTDEKPNSEIPQHTGREQQWMYRLDWVPAEQQHLGSRKILANGSVLAAASEYCRHLSHKYRIEVYAEITARFDRMCSAYIAETLVKLGFDFEVGKAFTTAGLVKRLGIDREFHKLFERFLKILQEDGILESSLDAGTQDWIVRRCPDAINADALLDDLIHAYPQCQSELEFVAQTAPFLDRILIGEQSALDTIFPQGDLSTSVNLYTQSVFARIFNQLAGEVAGGLVENNAGSGPLRILEIGAGTGGTSSFVLPRIKTQVVSYVYTDVSQLFLEQAKKKFSEFSFVEYKTLNIERDPAVQGFTEGEFDIVIAANVIHATNDLRAVLNHVHALMAPGGTLLLVEILGKQRFADLTVGLLDGWWRFTDKALRVDYPLLFANQWQKLLNDVGFRHEQTLPDNSDSAAPGNTTLAQRTEVFQHAVILASKAPPVQTHKNIQQKFLLFASAPSLNSAVLRALRQHSPAQCDTAFEVISVKAGETFSGDGLNYIVNPRQTEDFVSLFRGAGGDVITRIIYLWPLECPPFAKTSADEFLRQQELQCQGLLNLIKVVVNYFRDEMPAISVVTRGAVSPSRCHGMVEPAASPLWGMGRAIFLEHPEIPVRFIDIDPLSDNGEVEEIAALAKEILFSRENVASHSPPETQIAFRHGERLQARLLPLPPSLANDKVLPQLNRGYRLVADTSGLVEQLKYVQHQSGPLAPDQVEIAVKASGLNFKDLLSSLNSYPGDAGELGKECSGIVTAVGDNVDNVKVGDNVIALTRACFSDQVRATAATVVKKPPSMSFVQAASVPVSFLTAKYALETIGALKSGETVLIHNAGGGVGLAALMIARKIGARIIATAGSPQKRRFIASLGVEAVFNSRSKDFASHIMALTGNAGVHIVLNALTGDALAQSIRCLASSGRFLELGKREIVEPVVIDGSYYLIDLERYSQEWPRACGAMLEDIVNDIDAGILPLLPIQTFPLRNVVEAFHFMEKARHVGKIVLTRDEKLEPIAFDPQASYLITGGLGGLGLLFAQFLAKQGARHIVLMGRRPASAQAEREIAAINTQLKSAQIKVEIGDVAKREDVARIFNRIRGSGHELKGILHCAGTLDDGVMLQQNSEKYRRVFAAKINGTIYLHQLSQGFSLDFFFMFSSVAAVLGMPGQSNHSAANAFLDNFAHYRRSLGLPASSINWGAWADKGAVTHEHRVAHVRARGMEFMSPEEGVRAFADIFQRQVAQVAVMPLGAERFIASYGDQAFCLELCKTLAPDAGQGIEPEQTPETVNDISPAETETLPEEASVNRAGMVADFVEDKVKDCLSLEPERVLDRNAALTGLGLDSLNSIELRNKLRHGLQLTQRLPASLVYDYPNINSIACFLAAEFAELIDKRFQPKPVAPIEPANKASPIKKEQIVSPAQAQYLSPQQQTRDRGVAIIGMGGRFAWSENVEVFWQHLAAGASLVEEVSRWDISACGIDEFGQTKPYCRHGSFLQGIDCFDPEFFNISGTEAIYMDPQQRFFLEQCWATLEDAGYAGKCIEGRACGVFAGYSYGEYQQLFAQQNVPAQAFWGNAGSVVPARIAYHLNLKGPAITVDTACSSSLVAMHLACQSLLGGECEMALAGGVFIQCTPEFYLSSNRAGMLSPSGKCFTFDARADGFVPGEGVGVVLLKPAQKALEDGDHIYGVIVASAVNQDGATNGITAPSARSQEQLQAGVYRRFDINVENIQMVEAHGTGTRLGDPIEFEALSASFSEFTNKQNYCALGSVKTNIGHATAAAGVAGVIKILLALKHQQIPPSINYQNINPEIELEGTPFYINASLRPWTLEYGSKRSAAVSAFGFSGTNAHLVIEEAPVQTGEAAQRPGWLIALSALSPAQLNEQLNNLHQRLTLATINGVLPTCADISYTLLTGRRHLSHRLAFIVRDVPELVTMLAQCLSDEQPAGVKQGRVAEHQREEANQLQRAGVVMSHCSVSPGLADYLNHLQELADLYVSGCQMDFAELFAHGKFYRVSLPTYPFARGRYWVKAKAVSSPQSGLAAVQTPLHPLLQRNCSDFSGLCFRSDFSGAEFFLMDHRLHGQCLLPGAAYLEMALAAFQHSSVETHWSLRLRQVGWARPMVVDECGQSVAVRLQVAEHGGVNFSIYSTARYGSTEQESADKPYCQGWMDWTAEVSKDSVSAPHPDLQQLRDRCQRRVVDADACYTAFAAIGLDYGPSMRSLQWIYVGDGEVLAQLNLPDTAAGESEGEYLLHPSLLDAALQASIALACTPDGQGVLTLNELPLPYALDSLEVFQALENPVWAHIQQAADSSLGVSLYNEAGDLCARLLGMHRRVIGAEKPNSGGQTDVPLFWLPQWRVEPLENTPASQRRAASVHHIVSCALPAQMTGSLRDGLSSATHVVLSFAEASAAAQNFELASVQLFEHLQALMHSGLPNSTVLQLLLPDSLEQACLSGLGSLLRSAERENPHLLTQVILISPEADAKHLANNLLAEFTHIEGAHRHLRYRGNIREVLSWQAHAAEGALALPWRDKGVYLISGGMGGVGLLFVREILQKTAGARIVLCGRSALSADQITRLEAFGTAGGQVEYRQVNVCDEKAVGELIWLVERDYGALHGVIHAAGVIRDKLIVHKTSAEFKQVLAVKTQGLINLDRASRACALDLFLIFSSTSSFGNAGQADYAAANGFMDGYAHYRQSLVNRQQRSGRTLAVNWGLWRDGGMGISAEDEVRLRQQWGLYALPTEGAMQALYTMMAQEGTQAAVVQGEPQRLAGTLFASRLPATGAAAETMPTAVESVSAGPAGAEQSVLHNAALEYFRQRLAELVQLPPDRVSVEGDFTKFGIDSIMVMQFTRNLEQFFGPLPKTLLFEHRNISELTGYFVQRHTAKLREVLHIDEVVPSDLPHAIPSQANRTASLPQAWPYPSQFAPDTPAPVHVNVSSAPTADTGNTAIIGLAGRYPGARDLRAFWQNLRDGVDAITEIPRSRWDYQAYFREGAFQPGSMSSKWGGFIEGVDEFDPLFFNISPYEAELMGPQERLFLQTVYHAIEDSGYTHTSLGADGVAVGVYVGVMYEEYPLFGLESTLRGEPVALPGNPSSIANRVSYFCDFQGPCMAVDTMCSSSLTAIHLALQSLRAGECRVAIAGGVNVSLHPNKYLMLSERRFASSTGRCESFGEGGDGYVPGEGVGAVVLKQLSDAEGSNDHIYGVIKASCINHGGKTNGYTVPNPNAQAMVVREALDQAGVDPRAVSYLEAHGTGTYLGDPIEIAGLCQAFAAPESAGESIVPFCAIGSVKSNIGHCESAAGIAALTKVLLQLQYRQLVPSLHSRTLNPHIEFDATPFVVQQSLAPWRRPHLKINGQEREFPRTAGISSFGAGGSNAHLIIEEYERVAAASADHQAPSPVCVLLSAPDEETLKVKAQDLLHFLQNVETQRTPVWLRDLAFTLQTGREAMAQRLAFVANTSDQLQAALQEWLSGTKPIVHCYQGDVETHQQVLIALMRDEDITTAIGEWLSKNKLSKLCDLWVKGLAVDWQQLYNDQRPQRISLPLYPFARERYWVTEQGPVLPGALKNDTPPGGLHPLLHQNCSDFSGLCFQTRFKGTEFCLADHRLHGMALLPAAAQLEMVLAAMQQGSTKPQWPLKVTQIGWARPLRVTDRGQTVALRLHVVAGGAVNFSIYSGEPPSNGTQDEAYCHYSQGWLQVGRTAESAATGPEVADLQQLQVNCQRQTLEAEACYRAFSAVGLDYGPSMRSLQRIHVGEGEVLAQLTLPAAARAEANAYILHPSLLDGALQASIAFACASDQAGAAPAPEDVALPYALDALEVFQALGETVWAHIQQVGGGRLNVEVFNETGSVCARLHGLHRRVISGDTSALEKPRNASETLLWLPRWLPVSLDGKGESESATKSHLYNQHHVLSCALPVQVTSSVAETLSVTSHLPLTFDDAASAVLNFEQVSVQLLEFLQALMRGGHVELCLLQLLLPDTLERAYLSGLESLLRSAEQEQPYLCAQVLLIAPDAEPADVLSLLAGEAQRAEGVYRHLRHRAERSEVLSWQPARVESDEMLPWREGGVYLISGGLGGLGVVFTREILQRVNGARIILCGRSQLKEEKVALLNELRSSAAAVDYCQLDVCDAEAVNGLVELIERKYGALHGIIHSAGVLDDKLIVHKSSEEFKRVLGVKTQGLVYLDWASRRSLLDLFLIFSSTSSFGNAGQADYSAANGFMDGYACYRQKLVDLQQRHGRTLVVNWGLWREGGMGVSPRVEARLQNYWGLHALPADNALRALYSMLARPEPEARVAIVQGDQQRLAETLFNDRHTRLNLAETTKVVKAASPGAGSTAPASKIVTSLPVATATDDIGKRAVAYFKQIFSRVSKTPIEKIRAKTNLDAYGIDSVMIMDLTSQLEQDFGPLPKTLFFEHQSIEAIADYFISYHRRTLDTLLGGSQPAASVIDTLTTAAPAASSTQINVPPRGNIPAFKPWTRLPEPPVHGISAVSANTPDIAIIGIAGRYPGAVDMDSFWHNLCAGHDAISEIPRERWDYQALFSTAGSQPGTINSKWGGFIEGVDEFDPLFFNISPFEAELIDPQERLFLQTVYHALEDSGYTRHNLEPVGAAVGIYVGVMYAEYQLFGIESTMRGEALALPGNPSSIANRVSYFCNFNGPCMAVDTMCSSSLTAIHLAVQSLQQKECAVAIAGGVNLSLHPNKYLLLSQSNFVSSKGRCESFGQGGDGYVPGEGVGAVVLKPLAQAEQDGDSVYALLKASSINHGGKTNGYTVPNPKAQSAVIRRALDQAGIVPEAISYLEAHGTGTSLGDPIEIAGLCQAFSSENRAGQFCSIGSVKSNIGHCESAAGIAALSKVLLQLQHGQLVPSLHAETLNPHIDFDNTPFVVQRSLQPWLRPRVQVDGQQREYPRIAGISSFGAGGSNAHLIVQEYLGDKTVAEDSVSNTTTMTQALILLSAVNERGLKSVAALLLDFIRARQPAPSLRDLAYNLHVSREHREHRLALIVGSLANLEENLQAFMEDRAPKDKVFAGRSQQEGEMSFFFDEEDDLQLLLRQWLQNQKLHRVAQLWCQGLSLDWRLVYGEGRLPRRIRLPLYPFARMHCWHSAANAKSKPAAESATWLHPLLQKNVSNIKGQKYLSHFTGQEFFIADHVIEQQPLLPAVAMLEMARAAAIHYLGNTAEEDVNASADSTVTFYNVHFIAPVYGRGGCRLSVSLAGDAEHNIDYRITLVGQESEHDANTCCSGTLIFQSREQRPSLDLHYLQRGARRGQVTPVQCYQAYHSSGFAYGDRLRNVGEIYCAADYVLAKITLPASLNTTKNDYFLHPALLDAALHSAIALKLKDSPEFNAVDVPYAIDSVQIFAPARELLWSFVRNEESSKLDIDVCDRDGRVCVRFIGILTRPGAALHKASGIAAPSTIEFRPALDFMPVWDNLALDTRLPPGLDGSLVLFGGDDRDVAALENYCHKLIPIDALEINTPEISHGLRDISTQPLRVLWKLNSPLKNTAPDQPWQTLAVTEQYFQQFLRLYRYMQVVRKASVIDWILLTKGAQQLDDETLDIAQASILHTARRCFASQTEFRLVNVDLECDTSLPYADIVRLIVAITNPAVWVQRDTLWFERHGAFVQKSAVGRSANAEFKAGGCYLVVGAGKQVEESIVFLQENYQAKIIWLVLRENHSNRQKNARINEAALTIFALNGGDQQLLTQSIAEARDRLSQQEAGLNGILYFNEMLFNESGEDNDFLSLQYHLLPGIMQAFSALPLDFFWLLNAADSAQLSLRQLNLQGFNEAYAQRFIPELSYPVKILDLYIKDLAQASHNVVNTEFIW